MTDLTGGSAAPESTATESKSGYVVAGPAPYYSDDLVTLHNGDAREVLAGLPAASVDCVVTSPPYYGLRDYGTEGQIGAEDDPREFVQSLVDVFRGVRHILADDGTAWLNIGDTYSAKRTYQVDQTRCRDGAQDRGRAFDTTGFLPPKNMLGIPWRVAFALQDDGWTLRNAIVWHKPNPMPESVTDRLSGTYEHVFLLTKTRSYYFDLDAIREPHTALGRTTGQRYSSPEYAGGLLRPHGKTNDFHENGKNPGDVWSIATRPFSGAHFATYPVAIPTRCIAAGCRPGGIVLDPFSGSGTTGLAAARLGRRYVGIDLNRDYLDLSLRTRLAQGALAFDCDESLETTVQGGVA